MRGGLVVLLAVWVCLSEVGCSSPEVPDAGPVEPPPSDAGPIEPPAYVDRGALGDGGSNCGACAVPCRNLGLGGGEDQMSLDDAGLWSVTVPCSRTASGPICSPTVFRNRDPDGGVRVIGRYPADGGTGLPVLAVADEEELFFHETHLWQEKRSVYRLPRGGGPYVEAFTTSGHVTLVGLDEANVYTLEEGPSLRLVAHERRGGGTTTLAVLPAGAGRPIVGALKEEELLVLRRGDSFGSFLERYSVDGGAPSAPRLVARGVLDITFEGEDPIALERIGQGGVADLVRLRRDGGAEVLLRSIPIFAEQIAVGGDSVVLARKSCDPWVDTISCREERGEVYRVSLTSPQQEDLCRGRINPRQVVTDGNVVYVYTPTGLLELRP